MICLFHEWERIETIPHDCYFDYSGIKVLVYKVRCRKCDKISNKKYTYETGLFI